MTIGFFVLLVCELLVRLLRILEMRDVADFGEHGDSCSFLKKRPFFVSIRIDGGDGE